MWGGCFVVKQARKIQYFKKLSSFPHCWTSQSLQYTNVYYKVPVMGETL